MTINVIELSLKERGEDLRRALSEEAVRERAEMGVAPLEKS